MTGRRLNLFSLLSIKFKSGDIAWYENQMSIDYTDLIIQSQATSVGKSRGPHLMQEKSLLLGKLKNELMLSE